MTWISSVMTSLMDAVSGLFLNALGTDMIVMEEYFPFVTKAYGILQYTAWALLFVAKQFDSCGPSFALPLTILTVLQFSLSPMLTVFFGGALGLYRPAIIVGTAFCLHALAESVLAPFGLIFYFDEAGKYICGPYYIIYEIAYLISLAFLFVSMIAVSRRFKRRDLPTIIMVLVLLAAAIVPLILFRVYTDYIGIGLCGALCYIYYNDLVQEDIQEKTAANQEKMYHLQEHTISAMSRLIESRDVTRGDQDSHISDFVGTLAENARRDGVYTETLDDGFIAKLRMMAPMHDIGKIAVSDRILTKPGKLTAGVVDQDAGKQDVGRAQQYTDEDQGSGGRIQSFHTLQSLLSEM